MRDSDGCPSDGERGLGSDEAQTFRAPTAGAAGTVDPTPAASSATWPVPARLPWPSAQRLVIDTELRGELTMLRRLSRTSRAGRYRNSP
jgi:hypothetical protein